MGEHRTRRRPDAASDARRIKTNRFLWVMLAIVLVPIVAGVVRHSIDRWNPEGDDAWVARRTMQVFTTRPPLIGQESTASDAPTAQGLSHPGPLAYYVMAIPYRISGWSPVGLIIGAAIVPTAAVEAALWLVWRRRGDAGALAAALVLLLVSLRVGEEWLVRPMSSPSVVLPLLAALIGLWAYVQRDRAGLMVAAVAGTYAMQTSLVVFPLAVLIVVAALGLWVVRTYRARADVTAPTDRLGVTAFALVAVAWLPPLIDQGVGSGNLSALLRYLLGDVSKGSAAAGITTTSLGLGRSLATVVDILGRVPGLGGSTIDATSVTLPHLGDLSAARTIVTVAALAAAGRWAWTRRDRGLQLLLAIGVAATVVAVVAFSRRPGDEVITNTYFVLWIEAAAAVCWLAVALWLVGAASEQLARHRGWRPAWRRVGGRLVAAEFAGLALLPLVVWSASSRIDLSDGQRVTTLSRQVRAHVPTGRYEVVGDGLVAWASAAKGLGTNLLAHGYDIRFIEWGGMPDEPRRRVTGPIRKLFVTDSTVREPNGELVAHTAVVNAGSAVRVWLLPADPNTTAANP